MSDLQDALDRWDRWGENSPLLVEAARRLADVDFHNIAWQFNEAVVMLREARQYLHEHSGLGADIDEGLPEIQNALKEIAALRIPESH